MWAEESLERPWRSCLGLGASPGPTWPLQMPVETRPQFVHSYHSGVSGAFSPHVGLSAHASGDRNKSSVPTVKQPCFPCRAVTQGSGQKSPFSPAGSCPIMLSSILSELRAFLGMRVLGDQAPAVSDQRPSRDKRALTSCLATAT